METICGRDPASGAMLEILVAEGVVTGIRHGVCDADVWIAPGLVDLQVNGYSGIDLNSEACTVHDVCLLVRRLACLGTTTFLPTIITAPVAKMAACLKTIAEARAADAMVRHAIPCVHLEGPHISPLDGYRGAHAVEHVRPPSIEEFALLQAGCGNLIGMVTLSPHWVGSAEFVRALVGQGIVVSLGHTHATGEQIRAAAEAGARLSTHLGNGIAAELPRHPNPLWEQLAEDRLSACFIADGAHLSAATMRAMMRAKGFERCVLVSDAVALAGSPEGAYRADVGGEVVIGPDGAIRLRGSNLLAGSGIVLKDGVARVAAELSLGTALTMATSNPGAFVRARGVLRVGADADLITFRWRSGDTTLQVQDVMVRGRVMQQESEENLSR
ncbi:N-acetylglucosamine 6-phosphate deacetylase [Granulicella pectinivorans]|jgi:N-acetylglucosamine-6-phosphate deacetylase|uniref:N-acetylglucosamine 6-phosphate deacetylase n=1 Tax=Granulicella pectinivorans TaxID=474950 RepID=A0A1I6MB38_9BACT|nr:amidohydrolase family protein [Granulicella pectinivorans]SFS12782.1 N-acetylglucosamine 6-phosphate deacetylase [Granulicella pectinivorans]